MKHARDVRDQLSSLAERVEIEKCSADGEWVPVRKALTAGFFYNTARRDKKDSNYRTLKQHQSVAVHPSSSLVESKPKCVIFHELVFTSQEYMRQVLEIEAKWLLEVAPHFYKQKEIDDSSSEISKREMASQLSQRSNRSKASSIVSIGRSSRF